MVDLGGLFGEGSVAQQMFVWNVLGNVISAAITPAITEITKLVNSQFPELPLAAPDAAQAVARGLTDVQSGADTAAQSGYDTAAFTAMVELAQRAPDLGLVLAAYHRQIVAEGNPDGTEVSLRGALTDAGIPTRWHDTIIKTAVQVPSGAEVMNAWLEGQIDEAEAQRRWAEAGMDPTWFQTAYNANGQAPTPDQALELLNRGIIPKMGTGPDSISYQQAFLEGPWRDKWLQPFLALAEYLPPPRTVTAMYHAKQLDQQTATDLLIKQGLTPQLAAAYLSPSQTTTTAAARSLTAANIVDMYKGQLITKADAINHLVAIRYSAADARSLLALADLQVQQRQYTTGVSRIRAEFLSNAIAPGAAKAALTQLGVPQSQVDGVIATWQLEVTKEVRSLTAAQVDSAWYYGLITYADAIQRLKDMGYSPLDAYLVLAVRNKGRIQGHTAPPGVAPPPPPPPTTTPTGG